MHLVLYHMFVTKDLSNRLFDYIGQLDKMLFSVAWAVEASDSLWGRNNIELPSSPLVEIEV